MNNLPRLVYGVVSIAALIIAILSWQEYSNPKIIIEWSTASELDTAGFNIYRGLSQTGPFEQINAQVIPSSSDPLTGGEYTFTDPVVEVGETYFYQLEEVELSGATTILGTTEFQTGQAALIPAVLAILLFLGAAAGALLPRNSKPEGTDD